MGFTTCLIDWSDLLASMDEYGRRRTTDPNFSSDRPIPARTRTLYQDYNFEMNECTDF